MIDGEVEFISEIKGGSVPKEYIPGVQKGIESVLSAGVVAGFPVLGMHYIYSVYNTLYHTHCTKLNTLYHTIHTVPH